METQLFHILTFIAHKEFQLENIRQLLCEEITFNITEAFCFIAGQKNQQTINIHHIQNFLGKEDNTTALESMVKFYSNNNLNLNLEQFAQMIITREDQLLSKLTLERQENDIEFPEYMVNYLKKLFHLQEEINAELTNLRKKKYILQIQNLLKYNKDSFLNEQLLKLQYSKYSIENSQKEQNLCCFISVQLALRYLKKGKSTANLLFSNITQLFIPQNCTLIQNYLKVQEDNFNNQATISKLRVSSPLVHKEFKKLKKYNQKSTEQIPYCYRQRISVQSHINRNKKLPSSQTVKAKIQSFSKFAEQKMIMFFKHIKKVIKLTAEINKIKTENQHEETSLIYQLFQEITKNDFMIPSQLRIYIQKTGFAVDLNTIFVFFKRYANPVTGKLSKKQFIKIFRPNHLKHPSQNKGVSLTLQDRRIFINIILHQMLLECKIQKSKLVLEQKGVDLREVFKVIDVDGKGKISRTDFQVTFSQITGEKLEHNGLLTLWRRMGKKSIEDYVQYDVFMLEMLPKIKNSAPKIRSLK